MTGKKVRRNMKRSEKEAEMKCRNSCREAQLCKHCGRVLMGLHSRGTGVCGLCFHDKQTFFDELKLLFTQVERLQRRTAKSKVPTGVWDSVLGIQNAVQDALDTVECWGERD